ncbi:MAG: RNA 2',3'-cyclic phosphodiesterase [Rhizobiaceae bacterium]
MPRLFTAIEMPADTALSLSMLRGGLPGARWIDPENYHITLRFFGDVDSHMAAEIANELARMKRQPLQLRLDGLDAFGGKKPHSLHASVQKTQQLRNLYLEQERMAQRIGLKPEGRKFAPHVTLARTRSSKGHDVANYLSLRGSFSTMPFTVNRFVLFSSRDSTGGGPYIVEEEYPLLAKSSATGPYSRTDHATLL